MKEDIAVNYEGVPSYTIRMEESFDYLFNGSYKELILDRKVCIVTDSNVGRIYLNNIEAVVKQYASYTFSFVFNAGEKQKNLDTVTLLYEQLINHKFDRKDILLALGGGVTGDLTGFCAATYLRGISFLQVPTSLLAQVDSSIGGKTGVDFKMYKNMVGAFHQPIQVYINVNTLTSLLEREFISGMAEIVKHAFIKDKGYFTWLLDNKEDILRRNITILSEMIYRSCKIKQLVVENDPKEKGERALLNFGHTLGHAIEKLMDFTLLHGECVSLGMVLASYISYQREYISKVNFDLIINVLKEFRLPITFNNLDPESIIEATKNDKKMEGNKIKFILLEEIGKAVIVNDVTDDEMRDAISFVTKEG